MDRQGSRIVTWYNLYAIPDRRSAEFHFNPTNIYLTYENRRFPAYIYLEHNTVRLQNKLSFGQLQLKIILQKTKKKVRSFELVVLKVKMPSPLSDSGK
jgi:hypothetical protein